MRRTSVSPDPVRWIMAAPRGPTHSGTSSRSPLDPISMAQREGGWPWTTCRIPARSCSSCRGIPALDSRASSTTRSTFSESVRSARARHVARSAAASRAGASIAQSSPALPRSSEGSPAVRPISGWLHRACRECAMSVLAPLARSSSQSALASVHHAGAPESLDASTRRATERETIARKACSSNWGDGSATTKPYPPRPGGSEPSMDA